MADPFDTPAPPAPKSPDHALVVEAYRQSWENIRHIRAERFWLTNIFIAVMAGGMALLRGTEDNQPHRSSEFLLMGFMLAFSLVALFSSLRLAAELNHALKAMDRLVREQQLEDIVGSVNVQGAFGTKLKLRWVFPLFYLLTSAGLIVVIIVKLAG